ncbi:MAG: hypothetical protein JXA69_19430, partial [Phycisphaerae bacterium]|nr:hypothetical protein [Phycisphaerae bacterium]
GAFAARPDRVFLAGDVLKARVLKAVDALPADGAPASLSIVVETDLDWGAVTAPLRAGLAETAWADRVTLVPADTDEPAADRVIHVQLESKPTSATVRVQVDDASEAVARVAWLAVLPPVLAIVTAIILRRVVLCLSLGIVAGGIVAVWPSDANPLWGVWHAFYDYLIVQSVCDPFRLQIVAFVFLICSTVGIAQAAGGIRGILDVVTRFCRTARAARVGAVVAGLLLFFDDYLNCIIVGTTMRPLTDRFRVSREKLAYIVDSTAAPVAGLAVVSTWIAFEISQIGIGLTDAGIDVAPYDMFIRTLPYRFYCVFALGLVLMICWLGRDFGPMCKAEQDAANGTFNGDGSPETEADLNVPPRARNAIIPIGTTIAFAFLCLWWTAREGMAGEAAPAGVMDFIRLVLKHANSAKAFAMAGAIGLAVTLVFIGGQRILPARRIASAIVEATRNIALAVVILFLAWSIGAACKDVGTATYLVAMFRQVLNPVVFATVVFILSCLIAFSTGTSYGTMAILLPNVVPLAWAVGERSDLGGLMMATMSIGAVLDGAIFGDHCSPISDTTILSAVSSRCNPIEHVRTQLPYAVVAMGVALVVGYIPVAMGLPPVIPLAAGLVVLWVVVRVVGKPVIVGASPAMEQATASDTLAATRLDSEILVTPD